MYQTRRFGLVSSRQEYQMLCRAERHMKQKKKSMQHTSAFNIRKNRGMRNETNSY